MHHFDYRNGVLHAEDVALTEIAEAVGTPFYAYSTATLERHYTVFRDSLAEVNGSVCFAVKANSNQAVLRTLGALGCGADVVSVGEMQVAIRAGIPASRIIYSGVGKTADDLEQALEAGVHQINVESAPELELLNAVASARGVRAPVALRVNPDVGAGGHEKITTGNKETKFGIEWTAAHAIYKRAVSLPGIDVKGIAIHIGSQIASLKPFEAAFLRVRDLVAILRADGIQISRLDLGGGLGVPYEDGNDIPPPPPEYAAIVKRTLGDLGCAITCEPGRLIVGNAGVLVSEVIYVKEGSTRTFAVVDAAMNDLMRPAMYDAFHGIVPVAQPEAGAEQIAYDVVGPVCETSDIFAKQRRLPVLAAGDLIAFRTAGAYGASMSNQYNTRPLIPEVLVKGDRFAVIRRRPTLDEMLALEQTPDWMA
ncbi:diaminopimelate decarboxylase [Novispirillum itersonii]|uniref:Diaminopimelate decarboxylase n=1 Tax=Novispirillum itersonii TaxID=189 RepID=A0A7X0DMX9_NOVIT|nr:diaminopimelate decarboxylase [Novispirillum itersonii]MBB6210754.1 diaminopimelate decarboxylase [Novispirillum itersonii]